MDPDVSRLAQLLVVLGTFVGGGVVLGLVVRVVNAWIRARTTPPAPSAVDDERVVLLQQTVDELTLQVERLAEAQQFTTKLLRERAAERDPAAR
jgi:hypothetical protein